MTTGITVGSRVMFAGTEWEIYAHDGYRCHIRREGEGMPTEFCSVLASRLTLVEPKFYVQRSVMANKWNVRQRSIRYGEVATFSTEGEARAYCAAANRDGLPVKIGESL